MDASILAWITAIGSVVTALGTAALSFVAHKTLTNAGRQLEHLKEDSARRTRPYVFLEIVPGLQGHGAWDLRIKNMGASVAHDVHVSVGELQPLSADDRVVGPLKKFLDRSVILPPSAGMRVVWRRDDRSRTLLEGAPSSAEAVVTYKGPDGKKYSEAYTLNTEGWGEAMPSPQEGSRRNSGSDKEIANIAYALRTLNVHMGELRR
ncbi:hypothetical protein [Brevibacterium sp. HMSC22B09]|uniref:hypothetical protein n=1 Tax=Brevibacterium sp. HMSC22B09 TaxID=1581055 RepID=UPI00114CAE17|nr:hypothetical protein [Brevibacterium sp. HMSC22B09]